MSCRYAIRKFLCAAVIVGGLAGSARAYDPPDLGVELFSADGVFLAEDEQTSVLEALASLASNFSNNPRVDDDLREKALAIALRLDPLHANSRLASRDLGRGVSVRPTSYFDSLSAIAETLWSVGHRLTEPPLDPEEGRLAPYLLELSLLVHPSPPVDRLAAFASIVGKEPLDWGTAVVLQREGNASTARSHDLFRDAVAALKERQRAERAELAAVKAQETPINPSMTEAPPSPPKRDRAGPIEPISATVQTVVLGDGVEPVKGAVVVTLRSPRGTEEVTFMEERTAASDPFPLRPSRSGLTVAPLAVPAAVGDERGWEWPERTLAEVRFDPSVEPPDGVQVVDALLPALVALDALVSEKYVSDAFILLGQVDAESGMPVLSADLSQVIEAGASLGRPYLLVPSTILEPLVESLQRSGRLELLFGSELVGYEDLAGAVARLTEPPDPALEEASAEFEKIEAATASRPLPELARLPSGQDLLKGILEKCPDHLSARAMLEYGRRPLTDEMRLKEFALKAAATVDHLLVLEVVDQPEMEGSLDKIFDEADARLLKLRSDTPAQARDLLGLAEDVVEASELYLRLTNRSSSIGLQRLRDARAAIAAYRGERVRLGLDEADPAEL